MWRTVFTPRIAYAGQLQGKVCFERAIWLPKTSALWNLEMPARACEAVVDTFVDRVLSAYHIQVGRQHAPVCNCHYMCN